jgi:hypothetical protein
MSCVLAFDFVVVRQPEMLIARKNISKRSHRVPAMNICFEWTNLCGDILWLRLLKVPTTSFKNVRMICRSLDYALRNSMSL